MRFYYLGMKLMRYKFHTRMALLFMTILGSSLGCNVVHYSKCADCIRLHHIFEQEKVILYINAIMKAFPRVYMVRIYTLLESVQYQKVTFRVGSGC